eukprot:NODE_19_length_39463_cov_0.396073.p12 type:complete len:262 gc:universal NODE_19_length_39463_cov_0.396073:8416-7631(-)
MVCFKIENSLRCPAWNNQLVLKGGMYYKEIVGDNSLDGKISDLMNSDVDMLDKCKFPMSVYNAVFCDSLAASSTYCAEPPQRICRDDCLTLQNSYALLNLTSCKISADARNRLLKWKPDCNTLQGTNCISLEDNKVGNCGLLEVDDICKSCSGANQVACSKSGAGNFLNTRNVTEKALAISGIVLVILTIIFLLCFPLYCKWKRRKDTENMIYRTSSFVSTVGGSELAQYQELPGNPLMRRFSSVSSLFNTKSREKFDLDE